MTAKSPLLSSAALTVLFIGLRTLSQILLKLVAIGQGGYSYLALLLSPLFYLAGMLYLAQAITWLAVLKRMPLSQVYPLNSLTVITLMMSAVLFFGESITAGNMVGALLIIVGVVIIAPVGERSDLAAQGENL